MERRRSITPEEIEQFNQKKYEEDYSLSQISLDRSKDREDFFGKLVQIKLALLREYAAGKGVLDLGCGNGDYLFEIRDIVSSGKGIDYTDKAVLQAKIKREKLGAVHLDFIKTNARALPFDNETFDLTFSFSTLFYIPWVEEAIQEISRTLKSQGVAVLELGNLWSLNTFVCRAYPEWAQPCHIKVSEMKRYFREAGFQILQWRAFQILPYWGERPGWLRPLLHPFWKKFFQREIGGKMLDEWICHAGFLRPVAFRQLIVCRKRNDV